MIEGVLGAQPCSSAAASNEPAVERAAVPASQYNTEQLATLYNQSRVDYIVPMPMNARRMEEYIRFYDIDLESSLVALNGHGEEAGLGMLGRRGDRAWLTRLGVIPDRRGKQLGQFMMEYLLEQAQTGGARTVQLEVIEGNTPAHKLFFKLGFEPTRRLFVIRRAPGPLTVSTPDVEIEELLQADIEELLTTQRPPGASWLDETASLLNAGSLSGMHLSLSDGTRGWIVFRVTPFQISHVVLGTPPGRPDVALPLLCALHRFYPAQDTKIENLPIDSPYWPSFQQIGYHEAFRRIEMFKHFPHCERVG